ncbi:MAG: translocation/assembly module TamB domain-containing protein, partial [Cytophagales bacterium]
METHSKIESCELNSFLRVTENTLQLHQLEAQVGNSYIGDSLAFSFNSYGDFGDFFNKVKMTGKLKNSLLNSSDLALFHPIFTQYPDVWRVSSADFEGTVEKLNIKQADVFFGKNSKVSGSAFFVGLPNISETFMDIRLKNSSIQANDLKLYLDNSVYPYAQKMGKIFANGKFSGFNTDFVTYANLKTDIGSLKTDLHLKFDEKFKIKNIEGDLKASEFKLGDFLKTKDLGIINANNKLNLKNLNTKYPTYTFRSNINNLIAKNELLENLDLKFNYHKNAYDCEFNIFDSLHQGYFKGFFDIEKLNYTLDADFKKLKISAFFPNQYIDYFSGKLNANGSGKWTEPFGKIEGQNLSVWNQEKEYRTKKFSLHSKGSQETPENWLLKTDHILAEANGDLNIELISNHIFKLLKPLNTTISQLGFKSLDFEVKDLAVPKFNSVINLIEPEPLFKFFMPDINLSKNTSINLSINEKGELNANMENNYFSLPKTDFKELSVSLNLIPLNEKTMVDLLFSSKALEVNKKVIGLDLSSNFYLDQNDSLFLNLKMEEPNFKNYISFNSQGMVQDSNLVLSFQADSLMFASRIWKMNNNNLIQFNSKSLMISRLIFNNENQIAEIFGNWGLKQQNSLYANLQNIDLDMFNQYLDYKLKGNASAMLILLNQNENFNANISMMIDSLVIDNRFISKIRGNADWDSQTERVGIDLEMLRSDFKILDLSGYVYPNRKENNLELRAFFQKTDVRILEPFTKSFVSNLSGSVSGVLNASGSFEKPIVAGILELEKTKFKINYTQCAYTVNDKLFFDINKIYLNNAKFSDSYLNQGFLTGGVTHNYFSDFKFDIEAKFQNLEALNTTKKDNSLYFGQAFANGKIRFSGDLKNIKLTGDLTSNKDTKLTILLNSDRSISKKDFITFKSKTIQKQKTDSIPESEESFNFEMLLNLELNKDALMDIIFDELTGDALSKSNGEGQIQLEIDSKGDFNMFGKYTISQGKYNFTYLNLIRKEFNINSNSTISWNGDPYKGNANLTANFEKFSPLTPIVRGGRVSQNDSMLLSRRYPTSLNMKLTGEIMRPNLDFNIDIKQTPPELNTYVQEFKNLIASNEQELNRQVLSLLLFGRLSPE